MFNLDQLKADHGEKRKTASPYRSSSSTSGQKRKKSKRQMKATHKRLKEAEDRGNDHSSDFEERITRIRDIMEGYSEHKKQIIEALLKEYYDATSSRKRKMRIITKINILIRNEERSIESEENRLILEQGEMLRQKEKELRENK